MSMKKSAATLRAEQYKNHGEAWFGGFTYTEVKGIGYEKGVHRREMCIRDSSLPWIQEGFL